MQERDQSKANLDRIETAKWKRWSFNVIIALGIALGGAVLERITGFLNVVNAIMGGDGGAR